MQVVHVFNSGSLSGPEMLVIPALRKLPALREVWSLEETRLTNNAATLSRFCVQNGIPVTAVAVRSRFDPLAIACLLRQIRALPDECIIHCHDTKASLYVWFAKKMARRRRIQLFATHHGALVRDHWISRLYEKMFVFVASRSFSALLSVSESEYKILRDRGVPEKILKLHRNGISRPALTLNRPKEKPSEAECRFVILARLSYEKNHLRAIQVLKQMQDKHRIRWTLDLLGDGRERSNIMRAAHELNIVDRVRMRGFVAEGWKELEKYDCLLSFSLGEGLPVSLLEAGWRRTPIFASAVGGVCELCKDGAGKLFSLEASNEQIADELAAFVMNPECMWNCAEKMHHRVVNDYSEQRWLCDLLKHYGLKNANSTNMQNSAK
ncbi:MAG: hypothetical protein RLZZ488_2082 [Pseudomonadota bacterium]|jgi:glycosyltransferase involved in cell wall biosynthesis